MWERAMSFTEYVAFYGLARSEGIVLRYLADAFRTLRQTLPDSARTEDLSDLVAWLGELVRCLTRALDSVRAMQNELIRSEKMAALGSLVAGVAHELNTPIGNSLTVATTIEEHAATFSQTKAAGQLTRRQLDEFVESIREGSSILTRTLNRAASLVSSFKQVAVDQTSDVRRVFSLRTTLTELATTLEPRGGSMEPVQST